MGRELSIACRCQLLVGSFDGASRTCPCEASQLCKLSKEQREYFANDERVQAAKAVNLKEFEDGQACNAEKGCEE